MKHISLLFLSLTVLPCAAQSEKGDSLSLPADTVDIDEVTVTAQRPLAKQEVDRVSYDVQHDEDAKATTIIEMLKKVPFVTVDAQQNITVKGSSNFKIYKNGRPNPNFSANAKEVFQSIPASAVKRIEVITEPGAKYDAEGLDGILNIVMDDDTQLVGFVGNANVGWSASGNHNANLWGTVQKGKLTLSANVFGQLQSRSSSHHRYESEDVYRESGNVNRYISEGSNKGGHGGGSVEASYEQDSLNLITGSLNVWYYNVDIAYDTWTNMQDGAGQTLYSYRARSLDGSSQNYLDLDGHLDYQHLTQRKGESLNLSYLISTTRLHNTTLYDYYDIVSLPDYSHMAQHNRNNFAEHTVQLDWTRPLWENHTLDLGAKYILRRNDSDAGQEFDNGHLMTSDFLHTTQVAALYAQYKLQAGPVSLMGGLRYEYSHLSAKFRDGSADDFRRNLNDWVPSLTANWRINDSHSLKLNYALRINRPGISYLNPARFVTTTSVTQGNPDLESSGQHNLALGYSLLTPKLTMNWNLSASLSNDLLSLYRYVREGIIYNTYGNVGKVRWVGLNGYVQWRPWDGTQWMLNTWMSYDKRENESQQIKNDIWRLGFYTQLSQQLPWNVKLTLSLNKQGHYLNGLYGYSDGGPWNYGIQLQRSFLKDDRLTVRAYVYNPFNSSKYEYARSYTDRGDYTGWSASRSHSRYAGISISLRIGSLNASVKKTNKTVENDDLQGRK